MSGNGDGKSLGSVSSKPRLTSVPVSQCFFSPIAGVDSKFGFIYGYLTVSTLLTGMHIPGYSCSVLHVMTRFVIDLVIKEGYPPGIKHGVLENAP